MYLESTVLKALEKFCSQFTGLHGFQGEIYDLNYLSLTGKVVFLCCRFQAFLSLVFRRLSFHRFLWVYAVWSSLCFLNIQVYAFCQFRNFSAIFLFLIFLYLHLLSSFWDSDDMNVRSFCQRPTGTFGLLSLFILGHFHFIFESLILSFPLHSAVQPIQ